MAQDQSTLVVKTETALTDRELLLNIYRFVEETLCPTFGAAAVMPSRKFEALNVFLDNFDVEAFSPTITVGLLRCSSRAKAVLPSWNMLLRDATAYFKRTNVPNWQGLMVGLTDEQGNIP